VAYNSERIQARSFLILFGLIFLIVLVGGLWLIDRSQEPLTKKDSSPSNSEPVAEWHAIHVSGQTESGDAHLLRFADGTTTLVDTGYQKYTESALIPYLKALGISKLDNIVVTHAHRNHYGGLSALAEAFSVGTIFFNPPDPVACLRERKRQRCSQEHVRQTLASLSKLALVKPLPTQGLVVAGTSGGSLSVVEQVHNPHHILFASNYPDWTTLTVNESSAVLKFMHANTSVLLPGDIGPKVGRYLANQREPDIRASLLAAPHHGINPGPGAEFYASVDPDLVVVSISPQVFRSRRGQALRDIAANQKFPMRFTYEGNAIVTKITARDFHVDVNPLP
jgi:competence protein ComEC